MEAYYKILVIKCPELNFHLISVGYYVSENCTVAKGANKVEQTQVAFKAANMSNLDYESNSFDLIYSVSVLEHAGDYKPILKDFHRLLKVDGILVLTFDISLDGQGEITIPRLIYFLNELERFFYHLYSISLCITEEI